MENIRVVLFVGGRCPHLPQLQNTVCDRFWWLQILLTDSFSAAYPALLSPFVYLCFSSVFGSYLCLFSRLCLPWKISFRIDLCRSVAGVRPRASTSFGWLPGTDANHFNISRKMLNYFFSKVLVTSNPI